MNDVAIFVAVCLAGGLGSAVRFLVDRAVSARLPSDYPWGLTVVNVTGSLVFGLLLGLSTDSAWVLVASAGFLGGYTTFSSAMLDTLLLAEKKHLLRTLANGVGMLLLAVGAAALGYALTA